MHAEIGITEHSNPIKIYVSMVNLIILNAFMIIPKLYVTNICQYLYCLHDFYEY